LEQRTSLSIDLGAALRRFKTEKRRARLTPRPRDALVAAEQISGPGRAALLLDTNVYIHSAAGRLPAAAAALVDRGLLFHCTVCVAELATGVANANPAHAKWKATRDHYTALIARIPATRLLTPGEDTWAQAGIIAGTIARCQNFAPHQRKECLNDALIYLTAAKAGLPILTANRDGFDLIQQLAQAGDFVYFEALG
jgi:predicted nucleic acid-binding protein